MFLRIVVPLDGSTLAETALPQAADLAEVAEVSVHLIRVLDFGLVAKLAGYPVHDAYAELTAIQESLQDEYNAAAAYLAHIQNTLSRRGLVVTTAVRWERPDAEILAATRPGDVVIIATHGRDGLGRWFLGSVAEGVARRAGIPVMLVPGAASLPEDGTLDKQATNKGTHRQRIAEAAVSATGGQPMTIPQTRSTNFSMFDLSGRVAIVTGAGSGLGRTFASALAEAGACVVCAGRTLPGLEETVADLTGRGATALAIQADVSDEASVDALVAAAVARFGRLDVMVNNAGVASVGPPESTTLADWRRVVDVNLTGVFLGARAAARTMIAAGSGGRIVNVASILGAVASEPLPATAYAASKGGVINLTRDLAVQWAPHGILVNAIAPAYFPSNMTRDALAQPDILHRIEQLTPMGRIGRPEELMGPMLFLASDASSYVTGQTLFVDGGWTAR